MAGHLVPHLLANLVANMAPGGTSQVLTWTPWLLRSAATVDISALTAHLPICS